MTGYLLTFGETMALMTSERPGPLAHASSLGLGIGGAESNVAIGVRRLGVDAVWCGRVGADPLGILIEREIRGEGVSTQAIRDDAAPTGLMIKERRTNSSQRVLYYRAHSAGSRIGPADIDSSLITGASVLHVSGITLAISDSAAATVDHAIRVAHDANVPVSFDVNYRSALWTAEQAAEACRRVMPFVDIVFAGEDEAAMIVGDGDPAALANRLTALGPSSALIKRGHRGTVAVISGELYQCDAVPIIPVDTVGAGDAFVAGYLAELILGSPVSTRLTTAITTGAFACLVPGDWEGFPRRHELALLEASESVSR